MSSFNIMMVYGISIEYSGLYPSELKSYEAHYDDYSCLHRLMGLSGKKITSRELLMSRQVGSIVNNSNWNSNYALKEEEVEVLIFHLMVVPEVIS